MSKLLAHAEAALTAAKAAGAEAADAIAVRSRDLSTSIRHGKPEGIEQAESSGIGLRVFVGQSSATLSTSDLAREALTKLAEQAVAIARAAPADPYAQLADAAQLAKSYNAIASDSAQPSMSDLQALARTCEQAGRSASGITNSEGADASASHSEVALVTSHGFAGHYSNARYALSLSLIAGEGDSMQRDYDYGYVTHLADLPEPEAIGKQAAARTLARMHPRKITTQTAPVYFEPRVARSLLSAFASAISGSAIARGTSFLKDALHTQIFANNIRITDDPLRPRGLASRPFDGEGVAVAARDFIAAGTLTSWVLDVRSANQLGLQTTGHASRGLSSAPHPSTTNLYMHAGQQTPEALMQAMGDGFYVTETIGHGTNLITGDYSVGASGFWVENGVKQYAVSEVTIAGNLRDMFSRLVPANDLEFKFATNAPTLAVADMTIAGN